MRSLVVCLAIVASLSACETSTGVNLTDLAALAQHQSQWAHRDFHSYTFDLVKQQFGGTYNVQITVQNDIVTSVVDLLTGASVDDPHSWPTIDDLFADAHGVLWNKGLTTTLRYDAQLGYISELDTNSIDPGGPFSAVVSNLHPL